MEKYRMEEEIRTLSLFSGYGADHFALKKLGIKFKSVGHSDIDKYANQCHAQNHNSIELGDVMKIDPGKLEDFDLLTGGFPCQSFSIAGKREGFDSQKTGNLFFEIIRIAKVKKPKYMLLENVKGILSHDGGKTHLRVLQELKKLGYGVAWKCLNSKHYGIPQNRERVWYVCKLGGWDFMEFMFPNPSKLILSVKDLLEDNVDKKYYLTKKQIERVLTNERHRKGMLITGKVSPALCARDYKDGGKRIIIGDFRFDEGFRPREDRCSPCLKNSMSKGVGNCVIIHSLQPRSGDPNKGGTGPLRKSDGTTYCLDTGNSQCLEYEGIWRRLTPTECFRLMGFLDDEINLDWLSDTQKYKLAGNGWDINLASLILKRMFKE